MHIKHIVGNIIFVLHLLFVLFIIFTPILLDDICILGFHVMTCILVLLHWYLNSDICALTIIEQICFGITKDESFIHRVVSPVYNYNTDNETPYLYLFLCIVAAVSAVRLYSKKDEVILMVQEILRQIQNKK